MLWILQGNGSVILWARAAITTRIHPCYDSSWQIWSSDCKKTIQITMPVFIVVAVHCDCQMHAFTSETSSTIFFFRKIRWNMWCVRFTIIQPQELQPKRRHNDSLHACSCKTCSMLAVHCDCAVFACTQPCSLPINRCHVLSEILPTAHGCV